MTVDLTVHQSVLTCPLGEVYSRNYWEKTNISELIFKALHVPIAFYVVWWFQESMAFRVFAVGILKCWHLSNFISFPELSTSILQLNVSFFRWRVLYLPNYYFTSAFFSWTIRVWYCRIFEGNRRHVQNIRSWWVLFLGRYVVSQLTWG